MPIDIDKLISDAIDSLADDNAGQGAECLVELAHAFAVTGMGSESFFNLRAYIVNEAKKRDQCPKLIDTKLRQSERILNRLRSVDKDVITTR